MELNNTHANSTFIGHWTREEVVSIVSFVYVIVSILMVVLWSAYLCFDGRREPKTDTHVIHKLAQSTLLRAETGHLGIGRPIDRLRNSFDTRSSEPRASQQMDDL
ncbi:hypothetical protein GCK32_020344 [Trichostrongylus colubriformis]|uniref:Uncharacterized protein n=1 Tax=Trichostrongylus colubriformis TaxID=6319 RepID=A0AAN8ILY1_TRICO